SSRLARARCRRAVVPGLRLEVELSWHPRYNASPSFLPAQVYLQIEAEPSLRLKTTSGDYDFLFGYSAVSTRLRPRCPATSARPGDPTGVRMINHDALPGKLDRCQITGSDNLFQVIDLGHQPPCDSLLSR